MNVYYGFDQLPVFTNAVLTIGTYDGVHFGHQQIIKRINDIAREIDGESILLTFDPHPRMILHPDDPTLKLISTIDEKIELLKDYGLQNMVIVEFSPTFASTPAIDYIEHILIKNFHPKYICVGYDHRFGQGRKGDIHLLREFSAEYGYTVDELPAQTVDEISVSSTKVRNDLLKGDIREANLLLAHPFSMRGQVIHGDKIGRVLGFPTANIQIKSSHKLIPASGVYAVKVRIDDHFYKGALSIGYRETVFDNSCLTTEVFILDFDGNLYNQEIELIFVDYLRPQIKYDHWDLLKVQIEKDVQDVRNTVIL
jgi:riboflavin kinase/FMN adenylyltransferase